MRSEYMWIAVVGVTWGGYPLLARWAGNFGARGTALLMLFGMLPIVAAVLLSKDAQSAWPTGVALYRLIAAGVLMGIGTLAFHALTTSTMDASTTVPLSDVAMLLVSAIGAIVFFSEPVTLSKVGGIVMLLGAMWLLHG